MASEASESIERWWAAGERVQLGLGGELREIFVRRLGGGPPMTLLHGFPELLARLGEGRARRSPSATRC